MRLGMKAIATMSNPYRRLQGVGGYPRTRLQWCTRVEYSPVKYSDRFIFGRQRCRKACQKTLEHPYYAKPQKKLSLI